MITKKNNNQLNNNKVKKEQQPQPKPKSLPQPQQSNQTKPKDKKSVINKTKNIIEPNPINQQPTNQLNFLSLKDQIDNLQSIYNNLALLDQKIDNTFNSQREYSESKLHEKLLTILELKEKNFQLFSKANSMSNINTIDEYLNSNYPRILQLGPKAENVIGNMNDLVSNINYGIDRFYLEDNLICDESALRTTIQSTTNEIKDLNKRLNVKSSQISEMKENYTQLLSLIMEEKEKCDKVKEKLDNYKIIFLGNNVNSIYQELVSDNKRLLNEIINEE